MKIAVFPNVEKQGAEELTRKAVELLKQSGIQVYVPDGINFAACPAVPEEELYALCDIMVTIGGDGTLLRHAKCAAQCGKPVLGINAGRLGFLTDIERDGLNLLNRLQTGDYKIESRMMLEINTYKNGALCDSATALNDAVISSGSLARLADMNLFVAGDTIRYRADGIIISTPTGSTAYSVSAGGPIIDPSVRCFTVTPICSHWLTARPILIHETSDLTVTVPGSSAASVYLTVDGRRCSEIDGSTEVRIKRASFDAKLINLSGKSFFKTLSLKF